MTTKRVTAFVGSGRKGHTHHAAVQFLDALKAMGDVDTEIVRLSDYNIGICRGCLNCIDKGEEFCPLKDDRDVLIEKIMASDGIVLATPNYSFQVSGFMKVFLDRLGFAFHRPRFFGKTFTSIVCQGVFGGDKLVDYLDFVGGGLQFNLVKGSVLMTRAPITAKQQAKIDRTLAAHAKRYYARLHGPSYPAPPWTNLVLFRVSRTMLKLQTDDTYRDYRFYTEKGWFHSEYYYPTHLNVLKKGAGNLVDFVAANMSRKG